MFRTIIWFVHFALSLIGTIPKMIKYKGAVERGKTPEEIQGINEVVRKWALSQIKYSGARVTVHGEENVPKDRGVLFISNHQGNFDIPLFIGYIDKPKGFIAKIELTKIPIVHIWMKYIDCVFMDRSSVRKSGEAIVEGIKLLKKGTSMVIFPEGTRSKGDKLGEFKAGSFKLATKSKVPIVPVTIKGSYKLMEQNGSKIRPADVELFIHPMIETANLTKEEMDELPKRVKSIIAEKL
ncbi:lysophospholipid acyltransferase family protein [Clostridium sp. 'White wine YQ']|uniref:lysophospholipid acyltransferase family protein n=1 Tax=Clostridium sp. 'White wine YQ' TaxID=3027474 RepID=UPI002366E843|nr:lysophospholipid acyltransferase family protein [Clostridium sp. 'White wine YQ']MDD7795213.1 lysophospholipid acyltransferase family protein [Clostridium sp. 'White wine YQ']